MNYNESASMNYDETINNIKSSFYSLITMYKKYYVLVNTNPNVTEYSNYFNNIRIKLEEKAKELETVKDNIKQTIDEYNKNNVDIKKKLMEEKQFLDEHNPLLKDAGNIRDGSSALVNNTRQQYNYQYFYNVEIIFGILILIYLFYVFIKIKYVTNNYTIFPLIFIKDRI